jgi:late competence protein required for DNA uptake (superfamily II DNA/RNA helicase)
MFDMRNYHCLDCGTELETENIAESCNKYYCKTCDKYWFQSKRIIIEWTSKKELEVIINAKR